MTKVNAIAVRKPIQRSGESVVPCRIDLPEHIYDQYAAEADKKGKDPELLMRERLVQVLPQNDQGLWFSAADKKRLEQCIGHMCSDANGALQRLEPLSHITVEGLDIRIDPTILKRLSTRTLRGQTLNQLIVQQVQKALKQYVGLLPY